MFMRIHTLLSVYPLFRRIYPGLVFATVLTVCNPALSPAPPLSRPIAVDAACTPATGGAKSCKVTFFIQPYQATRFLPPYGGNEAVLASMIEKYTGKRTTAKEPGLPAKFSKIDKSQALAEITLNTVPANEPGIAIMAQNTKTGALREIQVRFVDTPASETPLVVLDSLTAGHRFVHRIATGKQPKSAMFISPTRVVLPLLDDNHIEVIDILSREVTRLALPPNMASAAVLSRAWSSHREVNFG